MICAVCYRMLRGQHGLQWRGTFDLHFDHHTTKTELALSASMGCCICRSIYDRLSQLYKGDTYPRDQGCFITAFLSEIHEQRGLYRLNFKLSDSRRLGTFLLQQTKNKSEAQLYTPSSRNTESPEVLQLARYWIRRCTGNEHESCPSADSNDREPFYPKRLVELPSPNSLEDPDQRVRLILTREQRQEDRPSSLYVTLSHCWGKAKFTRLLKKNLLDFQKSIPLDSLPLTFRNAIIFASRLDSKIRYIWIDSLCIIQDDKSDWLSESEQMFQIYKNAYCNISATAATDGGKGLFFPRDPHHLWEDEINLNTEGVRSIRSKGDPKQQLGLEPLIRRCTVLDLSFWSREVDDSPVNKRAWVLQERFLAPRVLHFCQDQIAWECRHLDAAECLPHGVCNMELRSGDVKERVRLKSLVPDEYGPKPVEIDPTEASDAAHENWKHVIERYSTTGLTNAEDKLIALAGIAEMMSRPIRGRYIAGMWEKYLASQLLWCVEPVFEDGRFSYPSRRPKCYRAPSFSWAAVDTPQGIRCAETMREEDLQIAVERIHVETKADNQFGLVEEGCYLELTCAMRKIEIGVLEKNGTIQYVWKFWTEQEEGLKQEEGTKQEGSKQEQWTKYSSVYLDSPDDDFDDIEGRNGEMYCVPSGKDSANYLMCLLLKKESCGLLSVECYRRVGLTKIPPYVGGQEMLWDKAGKSKMIRVI